MRSTGMRRAVLGLGLVALVAAGCGDDDADPDAGSEVDDPVVSVPADTPPVDAPPADLSSSEVCDALPADVVGAALGTEVEAEPFEGGTPQCSYTYDDGDGVTRNVVVGVQRSEADLGGRVGREAYDHAVELNQAVAGDAEPEPIASVGDAATYWDGEATNAMVVLVGARVVTVFGSAVTSEQAGALASRLAAAL